MLGSVISCGPERIVSVAFLMSAQTLFVDRLIPSYQHASARPHRSPHHFLVEAGPAYPFRSTNKHACHPAQRTPDASLCASAATADLLARMILRHIYCNVSLQRAGCPRKPRVWTIGKRPSNAGGWSDSTSQFLVTNNSANCSVPSF